MTTIKRIPSQNGSPPPSVTSTARHESRMSEEYIAAENLRIKIERAGRKAANQSAKDAKLRGDGVMITERDGAISIELHEHTPAERARAAKIRERIIVPEEYANNGYMNLLVQASETERRRLVVGVPVTGLVRIEWVLAKYSQTIPCNWSVAEVMHPISQVTPLGYDVKDARNICVQSAVLNNFEWLFFNDSDTIMPPDCYLKLNEYMRKGDIPIVAGVYFTKSQPSEPLLYRGRGNSYFAQWKLGEKVWCDGTGMGCTLINVKLLKAMYADAPEYLAGGNQKVRKVFDTPQFAWIDPEVGIRGFQGTEDLSFFDRIRQGDYLAKAGFKQIAKKKYFVLCDTSIFCRHIDPNGVQYPLELKW